MPMPHCRILLLAPLLVAFLSPGLHAATNPAAVVPAVAPRTAILAGRHDAFRASCTTGEGAAAFAKIKADLDRDYLALPFPEEPMTYGDPAPTKRTAATAAKWRDVQDVCGVVSGVAEAAALCWIVTGEEKYLSKAKDFLLGACRWNLAPDWRSGAVRGATAISYNDEGHFRLWRKLPLVYDQIRGQLSAEEKKVVLDHFRARGRQSVAWIEQEGSISQIRRNSIEADLSSHPVRFMPMTGVTALALWDDLPEAREWWAFAHKFYRDQFTPWGGDDGGWGEGSAYWRGTFEHAAFQDALLALGDPSAYATPFWKNSPLFALYNVQPYLHTIFGDASNAGRFNLEPVIADYLEHLARVQQNGFLRSYAALCTDPRPRPLLRGLGKLDRTYPTAAEFLVRNFIASARPLPPARPLSELPPHRYFADVGWVSMHSALGQPADDIHLTFISSPYGSFSHSHAAQNAFILNAYGEGLAINSAYREFHNSPHHDQWTRQTRSKNALLIDGTGQKPKSKQSVGRITRFVEQPRAVWTTGDATRAYALMHDKGRVRRVTRDVVFIDQRYFVLRDRVSLKTPGQLSWLLHSESPIEWVRDTNVALTIGHEKKAALAAAIVAPGVTWRANAFTKFPVPVDDAYVRGEAGASYVTGKWHDQGHLTLESEQSATDFTVFAVLWPERLQTDAQGISPRYLRPRAALEGDVLTVTRPDGKSDRIRLTDDSLAIE